MPARVLISTEEGVVLELSLGTQPVTIGRTAESTVRLTDRRTSRQHAVIRRRDDGGYEVEDISSTYGTLLNGRPVMKERLGHMDQLALGIGGGLQVQFFEDPEVTTVPQQEQAGADPVDLVGVREDLRRMIDEQAELRRELGAAREAQQQAERQRDEEHEEAARLREAAAGRDDEMRQVKERLQALGNDLRNERSVRPGGGASGDAEAPGQKLAEAQRQAERHRARAVELEEREAALVLSEQKLKKEVERLAELNQKREKREAELTQAVKPALLRVAQLSDELEKTRLALAQAQADLEQARRGR